MEIDSPFACIANDSGLVSEILHVSPMFVRCGPPTRGVYPDRRLARARRTDARHASRGRTATTVADQDRARFFVNVN